MTDAPRTRHRDWCPARGGGLRQGCGRSRLEHPDEDRHGDGQPHRPPEARLWPPTISTALARRPRRHGDQQPARKSQSIARRPGSHGRFCCSFFQPQSDPDCARAQYRGIQPVASRSPTTTRHPGRARRMLPRGVERPPFPAEVRVTANSCSRQSGKFGPRPRSIASRVGDASLVPPVRNAKRSCYCGGFFYAAELLRI